MRRTGSIYFLTLASAIVVVALALGLSHLLLQFRRTARIHLQADQARIHAEMGIRHALFFTTQTPNWRQLLGNGVWLQNIAVGQAVYSVSGVDPVDGNLQNNNEDPVILTCSATLAGLTRTLRVQAQGAPSSLLRYAAVGGGTVNISNHVRINGDVTSNSNVNKTGADTWVFGNVEAVTTIHETTNMSGSISPGATPKTLPDSTAIFPYYQARATPIVFRAIIENVTISPVSNPYGQPNPDGLYSIDCANQKIDIRNFSITGTLLLINPKSDSVIEKVMAPWQPVRPDFPALLIQGTATLQCDSPTLVRGTIYSSGNLTIGQFTQVTGPVLVGGILSLKDTVILNADPTICLNPTRCFREPYLLPTPGSWQQITP